MKVSVIIPTFNGANLLGESLKSWTRQSVSDSEFEVIVVDNNSTDHSYNIIQNFINQRANFRYLKEIQPGATHARHAGAKQANAEILVFADNDGLYNPECLEEIIKVYEANPEVAAVAGRIELLWDKTPPEWIKPYEFMLGKLDYGNEVVIGKDLYLNSGLFSIKRNIFYELRGFNPDLVGDLLTGDGDTGLVRKLHENHLLIGWTPNACMQHMQFVDKHGTISDMGRRFYNIGISETYALFRKNNFNAATTIWKQFGIDFFFLIKKGAEYLIYGKKSMRSFFSFMQHKGEISFYIRWLSPSFRISCRADIL